MSQENFQTMIMQNFWGVKEVYYGIVQAVNGRSMGGGPRGEPAIFSRITFAHALSTNEPSA